MQLSDRIGRRLRLHDLHVLMAVVQAGSMRKAAASLNTTQPTISRSVAELEHVFGVRLLDRSVAGVEPTQYGRALLRRGAAVFDELKQSGQDIAFLANPETGELRIGSGLALAEGLMLAVIDRLTRRYPRVVYHVVPGTWRSLVDELRERRIELFLQGKVGTAAEEDIDEEVLFEEPLVVVAGKDNPWARRRKIDLAELVNEPWALQSSGGSFTTLVEQAFRARGLALPRATVCTDASNVRIRLAIDRGFLTFIPASVLKLPAKHSTLRQLPIDLPKTLRQIGIFRLKNRTLSPVAHLFADCAREVAKPLAMRKP